jgi:hypothetical protein
MVSSLLLPSLFYPLLSPTITITIPFAIFLFIFFVVIG